MTISALVQGISFLQNFFMRGLLGSSVGIGTTEALRTYSPLYELNDLAIHGHAGIGGYLLLLSEVLLLVVWGYNVYTYRGILIVETTSQKDGPYDPVAATKKLRRYVQQ